MSSWRTIAVLFAIVVLLSVILGIKIINNTPEKQIQDLREEYTDSIEKNEELGSFNNKEPIKSLGSQITRSMTPSVIVVFVIILLLVITQYIIYFKLGINVILIKINIVFIILTFATIFFNSYILSLISIVITAISTIILIIQQYKVIGVNPYLLLLGFIPVVGTICSLIVSIIATCRLADYFGKGTGFKLGLIFLPFIFMPILAFTAEE